MGLGFNLFRASGMQNIRCVAHSLYCKKNGEKNGYVYTRWNIYIYIYIYICMYVCMYLCMYICIYSIMKTICPTGYYHNGFLATHALGDMMYTPPSCFCEIWALCVLWITCDQLYKYIRCINIYTHTNTHKHIYKMNWQTRESKTFFI